MDIGALIKAPTEDSDWIKKCLVMGLIMLIPIAGVLNLLGWMKACYEERASGRSGLPEAGVRYIGDGFKLFLAFLPMAGALIALAIVTGILAAVVGAASEGLAGLIAGLGALVQALAALAFGALGPAILYRHFVHGDAWASLRIGDLINLVKNHTSAYVTLFVVFLLAGLIGSVGQLACVVGVLLTMPFGYAVQAFAVADFARETNRS